MRTVSHYLIIMLTVLLFIFRLIVTFTTAFEIEFAVTSLNVKLEIGLLFVTIISIILMSRNKISGAVILTVSSLAYYGVDILEKFKFISQNTVSFDTAMQLVISAICVIIPVFAFFIIAFAKEQEKRPVDKKTDFFYKNEAYDRKYDERADKNNYRIM